MGLSFFADAKMQRVVTKFCQGGEELSTSESSKVGHFGLQKWLSKPKTGQEQISLHDLAIQEASRLCKS